MWFACDSKSTLPYHTTYIFFNKLFNVAAVDPNHHTAINLEVQVNQR